MTLGFALIMAIAAAVVLAQAVTGEIWIRRILVDTRITREENPTSSWLEIAYQSLVVLGAIALKMYPHLFGLK